MRRRREAQAHGLEKVELPQEVSVIRSDLVSLFPLTGLPELLMEVNRWTPFAQELTHLTGRRQPSAEREAATLPVVFAVLVAEATNLGLATMANSSGIALPELEAVYDWYFREETLRATIHHLITYHGTLPLTPCSVMGRPHPLMGYALAWPLLI